VTNDGLLQRVTPSDEVAAATEELRDLLFRGSGGKQVPPLGLKPSVGMTHVKDCSRLSTDN